MQVDIREIQPGWEVYDATGSLVGTVQAVGDGFVRMKTGGFFAKEYYIPRAAVVELETHRIEVIAARSEFGDAGWENPPLEVTTAERTH
jgi:hypothetical protein